MLSNQVNWRSGAGGDEGEDIFCWMPRKDGQYWTEGLHLAVVPHQSCPTIRVRAALGLTFMDLHVDYTAGRVKHLRGQAKLNHVTNLRKVL